MKEKPSTNKDISQADLDAGAEEQRDADRLPIFLRGPNLEIEIPDDPYFCKRILIEGKRRKYEALE